MQVLTYQEKEEACSFEMVSFTHNVATACATILTLTCTNKKKKTTDHYHF